MKKITPAEAKALNENFVKTRSKELNKIVESETGKPNDKDAISSWFSLGDLKEYIAYVEAEAKAKNISVDGLRVYFGAYSKNDKKQDKKGLSTMFFVPTQNKLQSDEDAIVSSDITDIDGMNEGMQGYPPSAQYPQ